MQPVDVPRGSAGAHAIHVLRMEQNSGIARALNRGLEHVLAAGYEFVARLDSGDTIHPARIGKQAAFLNSRPDHALVGADTAFVNARGDVLFEVRPPSSHQALTRALRMQNCLIHSGVMLRTQALRESGFYDPRQAATEDYELFLRLSRRYRIAALPEVLTFCHQSSTGISITRRQRQNWEKLLLQARFFEWRFAESYWGLIRTLIALCTPFFAATSWKQLQYRMEKISE